MKYVIFVDYSSVAFDRLPKRLEPYLDYQWFLFNPFEFALYNSKAERIKIKNFKNEIFKNSILILSGHRPWDLLLAALWRSNNQNVFYVQHGIYITSMPRKIIFNLESLNRIFGALVPSLLLSLFFHPRAGYHAFVGRWRLDEVKKVRALIPKTMYTSSFVYDDDWALYHMDVFGDEKLSVVGAFDMGESLFVSSVREIRIVYVMQSLAEDGRARYEYQNEVISSLSFVSKKMNIPVYYKSHPRSSKKTIKKFSRFFGEVNKIYKSDVVVGHYSSLMDKAYEKGLRCFVMDLSAHVVPKEYLQKFPLFLPDKIFLNKCSFNNSQKVEIKNDEFAYEKIVKSLKDLSL